MDGYPIRVMLVDDDQDDYLVIGNLLAQIEKERFDLTWVAGYEEALEMIGHHEHDIYLLDYHLGEHNGLDLLREAPARGCQAPMILLTSQAEHQVEVEAIEAGAADSLIKEQLGAPLLDRSIRYAIERTRNLETLRRNETHLQLLTEYQQTTEKLRQTTSELQAIFQALPDLFLRLDFKGTILNYQVGPAFDLRLPSEILVGQCLYDIFPSDIVVHIKQAIAQALETKLLVTTEFSLPLPYGEQSFEIRVLPRFEKQVIAVVRNITERKQAEKALRDSETRYRAIVEDQTELICRFLPDGTLTFVNEACCRYFKNQREKLIGHNILPLILPEDRCRVMEQLNSLTPEKPVLTQEHRMIVSGKVRWQEWTIRAIFDEQRNLLEFQSVGRDITEQKQAEEALRQSEKQYRSVVDNVKEVIFQIDPTGAWTFLNPAWTEITGFSIDECLGMDYLNYIVPTDRQRNQELFQYLLDRDQEYWRHETRFITKDGGFRWFEAYAQLAVAADDTILGISGTLNDISDRKRAEAALRTSEIRFRTLTTHAPVGIFQNDPQGNCVFVNKYACEIAGITPAEALGMGWTNALHPQDRERIHTVWNTAVRLGQDFTLEYRFQASNGKITWVLGNAAPLRDESGEIVGFLGTITDITERKEASIMLAQRVAQLALISDISSKIAAVLELDSVLDRAADLVQKTFNYDHVALFLLDRDVARLKAIAASSQTYFLPNHSQPLTQGIIGRVATHGEKIVANDVKAEPHYIPLSADRNETKAELCLPIKVAGQTVGVLDIQSPHINSFTENDVTAMEILTDQIAVAIENARLYQTINQELTARKQTELLERDRNQVLEMVAQNQPLEAILTELVCLIERQRPEMLGSILLVRDGRVSHMAAPNLPDTFTRAVDGLAVAQILGARGPVTYDSETVIMSDIANTLPWNEYYELAQNHNLRACWSTPIFSGEGAMLGTVTMYYRQPARPETADLQLIRMASRLAAIAIEQRQLADQLTHQARHDALTGLPNRLLFRDCLQEAIAQARQHNQMVGLLYIDLDRFKMINDTLGHAAGDRLLTQFTQRLQTCIRPSDTLARIGGDEFTLVLPKIENPQSATRVAQRILEALHTPFLVIGHEVVMTASIGISLYPTDGDSTEEILRKADQALYRSKESGKNSYQFYTPVEDSAALQRLSLENQLRGALGRGQLQLYYQPQFEVSSGRIIGLEGLLRWNHPELGLISPANFIPIAEESGLIIPIGAWVIREACRQNRAWQQAGYSELIVAVNVSTLQFAQADFVETVVQALEYSNLEPGWLQLELTESLLMRNPHDTAVKLAKLRALGVIIALDDFGTGYSSLSYLRQLPIDTLKIAQPFVCEIGVNLHNTPSDVAIITAVTNLAHSLEMRVVAEGVETQQQLELLRRIGCDEMQGFLFSKPLPVNEFEGLLKQEIERRRQGEVLVG